MKWKGIVSQLSQRTMARKFAPANSNQPSSQSLGRIEAVAGVTDGTDRGVVAELLAQATDADVDDVGAGIEVVAPDLGEQTLAAEHLARIGGQLVQQLELAVGELDDAVAGSRLPACRVEDEPPDLEHMRL